MKTDRISALFGQDLNVINIGLENFAENLAKLGTPVTQVEWKPPAGGNRKMVGLFARLDEAEATGKVDRDTANQEAVTRILKGKPTLIGIGIAKDVVPGMHKKLIMHAGPPIKWKDMAGPLRGAVIGGLIYEGLAKTPAEAEKLAASGEITFDPCHHHNSVGPMAGVTTASMPVWIMENTTYGNRAYCTLNEGLGKVLRYGANSEEVIERLRWMEKELAPILKKALELHGPLDMKNLIAQVLQMGDEGHNRNRAGTSLLIRELAPYLVMLDEEKEKLAGVFRFMHENDHFFLNLTMPAAKCTVDAAAGIEGSSLIYTMARNGTEFGIRLAGMPDRWFTGPASEVDGLYLPGYSADDAARDIGDSVITETSGIGGFAMAAAPAIVKFVGGTPQDALNFTRRMYEITLTENDTYQIPAMDFRGTPTGIDVVKVVETGVLPAINTGIAHKDPGVGMVGAGLVKPPEKAFQDAFEAYVEKYAG
ncbi:MAG: DUF1116 domain-containing protein [Spirochaetaceae bacterium]|nr:MAG: DUF1116 domain-containing protein [Spirochaetaceae bacterium]